MMNRRPKRRKAAHHSSDSRLRNLISVFFAFLLSMLFVIGTFLMVVRFGVLNESRFLSVFDEDYYQYTMDVIRTNAEYYTTPTGIDLSVLDDAFNTEEIEADVRGNVHAAFSGSEYTPDTAAMARRLDTNLRAFFAEHQLVPEAGTIQDVIDEFTTDIVAIYADNVKLPGLASIGQLRARYLQYDRYGIIAVAVIALILIITIIRLHHYIHRSLRYIAYAAGGAALMCFIVPCGLYLSKFYVGFNFQPRYFYHFMVSLVVKLLESVMLTGLFWLLITVVLAFMIAMRRRQLMAH